MTNLDARCTRDRPLSVVLGAGAVRGMAHIGVLEVLQEEGFQITEMVGTSVGALIVGFYGVIGRDLRWIRQAGLGVRSTHLLAWAFVRRLPDATRRRFAHLAGDIPSHVDELAQAGFDRTHHGVSCVGLVSYDVRSKTQIVVHSENPIVRLEDAVRGAIAVPGLFPPWKCRGGSCEYELVDGGDRQRLPVDVVFDAPFRPAQVLMVDVSNKVEHRRANIARLQELRRRFPHIPLDCICVDTLSARSVVYKHSHSRRLLESGREAALEYIVAVRANAMAQRA